jgi:hypothetical protein
MRAEMTILVTLIVMFQTAGCSSKGRGNRSDLFKKENLVAWCIVPFDANKRTAEERASMLLELGINQLAYDYRDEHIPLFKHEIEVMEENGIALRAVWMWVDPVQGEILNDSNREILQILEETGTRTEIWLSFPEHVFEGLADSSQLEKACSLVSEVLGAAEKSGCTLALYNHGGWFGEPENQVRIIRAVAPERIRIVYNFHHGHHQIDRFGELLEVMMPYLSVININGMKAGGPKILPLGEGDREKEMLGAIVASGYKGPIGILGHTEGEDIRTVLQRNLKGLERLSAEL